VVVAAVLEVLVPDGSLEPHRLLVLVHADGTLAATRVVAEKAPWLRADIRKVRDGNRSDRRKVVAGPEIHRGRTDESMFVRSSGVVIARLAINRAAEHMLQYARGHHAELFRAEGQYREQ
jgi:hypothetical protein